MSGEDRIDQILMAWQRHRPDSDLSGRHIIWRIQLLAKYIDRRISEMVVDFPGLSSSGARALQTIYVDGPPYRTTPGALAEGLMLTSGTMTSLLDRLARAGMIERLPDPNDRRGIIIQLTERGVQAGTEITERYEQIETEMLAPLSDSDRQQLVGYLRALLLGFEQYDPAFAERFPKEQLRGWHEGRPD